MSGQDTNETSPLLEEQNPLKGSEDLSGEERRTRLNTIQSNDARNPKEPKQILKNTKES